MAKRGRFGVAIPDQKGAAGTKPSLETRRSFAQRQEEARARLDAQRRWQEQQRAAAQAAQRRRAQAERIKAQRAAQKRAQALEASRRAEEQKRRAEEQIRRSAEQKRRVQLETSARQEAIKRREQYTVKRGDTAASIARSLETSPKEIAEQTQGALRAGQIQTYNVTTPADRLRRMEQADRVKAGGGAPILQAQGTGLFKGVVENFLGWVGDAFGMMTEANLALPQGQSQDLTGRQLGLDASSPFGQAFGPTQFDSAADLYDPSTFTEATPASYNISPEEMKAITDRTRDIEMKQTLQKTYSDIKRHEDELYEATIGLRAKTHAAAYAWETGDLSVRPDFFTEWEWENLSPENKRRYQEDLGYVWDDVAGVWVPLELEEEGYGMGGYDYGDYGGYGGGGGGGGEYTPPIYTGAVRGYAQGGRTRGGAERLTSSYIPASHWRI